MAKLLFKVFVATVFIVLLSSSVADARRKKYQCPKDRIDSDELVCPDIYEPVCGHLPCLTCITTPCNHRTYPNSCQACGDQYVKSYKEGECRETDL